MTITELQISNPLHIETVIATRTHKIERQLEISHQRLVFKFQKS